MEITTVISFLLIHFVIPAFCVSSCKETCSNGKFCDINQGRCHRCTKVTCLRQEIPYPCRNLCPSTFAKDVSRGVRCRHEICPPGHYCDFIEGRCGRCSDMVCVRNPVPEPCKPGCSPPTKGTSIKETSSVPSSRPTTNHNQGVGIRVSYVVLLSLLLLSMAALWIR